jgi:hypothetical protein
MLNLYLCFGWNVNGEAYGAALDFVELASRSLRVLLEIGGVKRSGRSESEPDDPPSSYEPPEVCSPAVISFLV